MPRSRDRSVALVAVLAFGLFSIGCITRTEWVPVRIAAPLGVDHAADLETNQCAHDCHRNLTEDTDGFYRCLHTCPGVVRQEATTCEDPAPGPEAFCYTQWVEHAVEDESGGGGSAVAGEVVARIFGALLSGLIESAASGRSNREIRSSGGREPDDTRVHSEPQESRRSRETPARTRHYTPAERRRR